MTLSIMTLSITIFSLMDLIVTLSITTFSLLDLIVTLSITTFRLMDLIVILSIKDIQYHRHYSFGGCLLHYGSVMFYSARLFLNRNVGSEVEDCSFLKI